MKYLVKINRDTIKYDDGIYQVNLGPAEHTRTLEQVFNPYKNEWITTSVIESIKQPTQTLYGFPGNRYEYIPTLVKCDSCNKEFLHTQLETIEGDWEDDYFCETNVCPYCKEYDCCELEYEKL